MIYLDANSTSRQRPCCREAALALLDGDPRNPSSVHRLGRESRALLGAARRAVLDLVLRGTAPKAELFFTSGGTEACNALIFGFGPARGSEESFHIICSSIEHAAVLEPVKLLEDKGCPTSWINPAQSGVIDVSDICSAFRKDTALVALMSANNESGAIQPVAEAAAELRGRGYSGAIVSDMTQALGKSRIKAAELFSAGVDAVAVSAHKIGALPGAGAVVLNAGSDCRFFSPLIVGGGQERGLRAGTENVLAAVCFGKTAEYLLPELDNELQRIGKLRDYFGKELSCLGSGIQRLTPVDDPSSYGTAALANTLWLQIPGCRAEDLVAALDLQGIACSTGAACSAGKQEVSHVALAMGLSPEAAREALRFSLDWSAGEPEIKLASKIVCETIARMRSHVPVKQQSSAEHLVNC